MDDFVCFKCKKNFFLSKTLMDHIKWLHPFLSKYECNQFDCNRSYKDINGLRKHILSSHKVTPNILQQKNIQECDTKNETNTTKNETNTTSVSNDTNFEISDASLNTNSNISDIEAVVNQFIAKLYECSSLNRSIVQLFLSYSSELIDNIFSYIKNKVDSELSGHLNPIFIEINNTFHSLGTEYRRLKYLEQNKTFIRPTNFVVGMTNSLTQTNSPNFPDMSIKTAKGQKISIRNTLEAFLLLPGVFQTMKDFMESEENECSGIYTSVFQGHLWKSVKNKFIGKTCFPLFIFFDDLETLNPLGSRAGCYKIGAVYMSLASVPPEYSSLLENIFLVQLFYSSDRNTYGNKHIFESLIEDLRYLETEGLSLIINGREEQIYFVLLLIIGDNLGLNSVLGFTESFNSEYYCRMCVTPKNVAQIEINDSNFHLRTTENYAQDSEALTRGLKESCIWHSLPNFHLTKNYSCDLMHDCFEGVLRYDMAFIIAALLDLNYFNLDHLNNRIKYFKFSKADAGNVMPQIKSEHLKKKHLIMSASEMLALTVYFGLLVGDLVPETEPVWRFYILILQLIDILLQRQFSTDLIDYLQILIKEHHSMYMELFQENLKPKYHFLLHYPNIIRNIGPPRYYWSMRFESFHRFLKCTANSVSCRKNLLVTLSLKQQLRLSSRLSSRKGFITKTELGPRGLVDQNLVTKFKYLEKCVSVSWITVENIFYKKDFALQLSETEFARIKNIITDEISVYFVLEPLECVGFCDHVQAFEVDVSSKNGKNIFVKSFSDLNSKYVYNIHFTGNGHSFIITIK